MHKLPKPSCNIEEHLTECISKCRINKVELQTFKSEIIEQANNYDEKAINGELSSLRPLEDIPFDAKSLINLYDSHMSKKGSIGRQLYDKLMLTAKGTCPFCTQGIPTTIDHFLPKDVNGGFPELSIVPINLVPCCKDCNHIKSTKTPNSEEDQFIHPYYDDINEEKWLFAQVNYEINSETTLVFYVDCPNNWNDTLKARIQNHFKAFGLNRIFSQQAATEMTGKEFRLQELFNKGGEESIRAYLIDEADSWEKANKNSWQAAMYYALAEDENICSIFSS